MNFNSFAGEERRVRPNKNLRAAWASDCLIIPEGAVELNSDEMSYVDGGGYIPTWMVSAPLDIAFMLCGLGFAFAPIKLFGKTFGKKMATRFIQNKGWFIADILVDVLRTISGGAIDISIAEYAGGVRVTQTADGAFDNSLIKTVKFNFGVANIGKYALRNRTRLTRIDMPANVTIISEGSFVGCSSHSSVTFVEGSLLTSLGNWVFQGCTTLTSIGEHAFNGCSNLITINMLRATSDGVTLGFKWNDIDAFDGGGEIVPDWGIIH